MNFLQIINIGEYNKYTWLRKYYSKIDKIMNSIIEDYFNIHNNLLILL